MTGLAVALTFAGLVLIVTAWLRLGRSLPDPGQLTVTMMVWSAPLAVIPPMFSRDAYSYLAQGAMVGHGLDTYLTGPASLGGPLAADVPAIWQHTPAPYGPVFLALAATVVDLTHEHSVAALLGMRLVALAGLALLVYYVPELARRCGVDPSRALWLGVLNPLVLVHLVAGMHNDALMVGVMTTGVVLVLRGRPVRGAVALTLAALIKAPAALALLFIVPLWAQRFEGRWRFARAAAATGAVAVATTVTVTEALGLGYGWVTALGTPTVVRNFLSISTDLGYVTGWLPHLLGLTPLERTVAAARVIGLLAALGITLYVLWRPQRLWLPDRLLPAGGPSSPVSPAGAKAVCGLGVALTALVVLGPVVHPWYLCWGTVILAAGTAQARLLRPVMLVSGALPFVVQPMGSAPKPAHLFGALAGTAVAISCLRSAGLLHDVLRGPFGDGWGTRDLGSEITQREVVAIDAEPADHPRRDRRHDGMVPELLTGVDVGDVHLDKWPAQERAGVP
jgi:alpha-1,6-mannosyltransferase